MNAISLYLLLPVVLGMSSIAPARCQEASIPASKFDAATEGLRRSLEESIAELNSLREQIAADNIPRSRELNALQAELARVRLEFQQATRELDTRTLGLTNLRAEIQSREEQTGYLANLFADFIRNFETTLHIAEIGSYQEALEAARLAPENSNLTREQVFDAQAAVLDVSLDRLERVLGGDRFAGSAVDAHGVVNRGTFVLVGPAAVFRSEDGKQVGTAEERLGSQEPAVIAFSRPEDVSAAGGLALQGHGFLPLDPTLGNAHKIEATHETIVEHVQKGGPVMVPIFLMAGAALLVALYKWLALGLQRKASRKQIEPLLDAVRRGDEKAAHEKADQISGPVGRMLVAGVEHLREPRELIEEVMYEILLTAKLRWQRFLPFISMCAASAPLLGLLGTVTGIINTFKLITVYGSGDVKTLSGGISEALITTEFGLIVAIPSLLIHAFLSRKVQSMVAQAEAAAIAFVNQVSKTIPRVRSLPGEV